MSKITGLAIIVAGLLGSYLIVYLIGGAGRVAPHLFYLPILLAGVRFGPGGGVITAIVSTALAGPAMPLDVEQGTPQHMSDWVSTGGFFLLIGTFFSVIIIHLRRSWRRELRAANQERESAVFKANILQNLTHELRTPLTVIKGMAKTLTERRLVEGESLTFMQAILRSALRLEELLGMALAASGIKERRKRLIKCELKPMVDGICRSLLEPSAAERVKQEPEVAEAQVTTDPEILELMLRCLIDNALKFSQPDQPISVRCEKADDRLEISIKDCGHGGPGVGLHAARKLAEEIKGEVDLVTPADGGTEAVIRIPQGRKGD